MKKGGFVRAGIALLASSCLCPSGWAQTSFYVDPAAGNDQAAGTSVDQPFRTLTRAQQAVRGRTQGMNDDIVVNLRGGTYSLTAPLVLGPSDSGTNGHTVIWKAYAGETPVLTSARQITGWRAVGNGQYRAPIGTFNFRQMFVDGVRATRARNPEVGTYVQLESSNGSAKTLSVDKPFVTNWANLQQVEMNLLLTWGENYLRFKSIDLTGNLAAITPQDTESNIIFQRPNPGLFNGSPLYFENASEFLSNPGEFYVDTVQGYVYYIPRSTESLSTASVTAPTLETLVDIRGDNLTTRAHDIRFSGITFADTTWMYATNNGELNAQGGLYNLSSNAQNQQYVGRPPAAVHAVWADRVQFDGNFFTRSGATALDIDHGVHDSAAVGNTVYDVSGNGIMIGKFSDPNIEYHTIYNPPSSPAGEDQQEVTRGINVQNNLITQVGRDYQGTSGINAGFVNTVNLLHNEISGVPWAAITFGWGWQSQDNALGNNQVMQNDISNALHTLSDTGGIYHLSNDRGSKIDYNYIHEILPTPTTNAGVYGVYLDEGSDNMSLSNNVMQNLGPKVNLHNTGPNLTVQNNDGSSTATIQGAGLESGYVSLRNRLNLAYNRPTTASSTFAAGYEPSQANDGNSATGWSPTGSDAAAWWQVDLGKPYQLSQVAVVTRQNVDQPETRTNFEVRGSNDASFASYTVLSRQDAVDTIPYTGTLTRRIVDTNAYRYVRIAKTDSQYFFLSDVRLTAGGSEVVSNTIPNFDPTRYYKIKNIRSGMVLDVYGARTDAGAPLAQWNDTGATNQQFQFVRTSGNLFQIIARNSGLSLNVSGASGRTGASVIQYPFSNKSHELWYFQAGPNGSWYIRSFRSDQVLEVSGGSTTAGASIDQWTNNGGDNQQWVIE